MPIARFALIAEKIGIDISNFPLTWYRNESFYILRTDALDRFGTRLEQRFTKDEISVMLLNSGLKKLSSQKGNLFGLFCHIKSKNILFKCMKSEISVVIPTLDNFSDVKKSYFKHRFSRFIAF